MLIKEISGSKVAAIEKIKGFPEMETLVIIGCGGQI